MINNKNNILTKMEIFELGDLLETMPCKSIEVFLFKTFGFDPEKKIGNYDEVKEILEGIYIKNNDNYWKLK